MSCDSVSVSSLVNIVLASAVSSGWSSLTRGLVVGGAGWVGGCDKGRTGRVMTSDFLLLLNFALPFSSLIGYDSASWRSPSQRNNYVTHIHTAVAKH